jgi:hypothetical protein
MAILFRKHERLSNLAQNSVKRYILQLYINTARLKEVAKEISTMSSGSEGNSYSVLKVI